MLKFYFTFVALVFFTVSPVFAAPDGMPSGKWWYNPRVTEKISISDDEKQSLDKRFVESRRKRIELKSLVEKEKFELENLIESKNLDEEALLRQFRKLEKARTDLSEEIFGFLIQARNVLGYERFVQLKGLHREMRWGRGPGSKQRSPKHRKQDKE
jgi:hypothetical protein